MMDKQLQSYVSRKLSHALEWIASRPSRHEGIYCAYEESLQWLEDIDNLSPGVKDVLETLQGGHCSLPANGRDAQVRKRISTMSEGEVCALIDCLESENQSILG